MMNITNFFKIKGIRFFFALCGLFPLNDNKIVISNFSGRGYGDNGKPIAEELFKRNNAYDIVWLVDDLDEIFPSFVRKVKRLSLRSIYEQCTAKIWIDNRRKPLYVVKRKNQFYIQTWHGNSALKKVEKDVLNVLPESYVKAAIRDSKMADLFLSSSTWETRKYRDAFWYEGEIMECGYPRQDILFKNDYELISSIKKKVGLAENDKVVFYAPTFRTGKWENDLSVYDLDYNKVISCLIKRFDGEWKGMVRLHPSMSKFANKLAIPANIINVTSYPDIQELLLISDCVITDYSSTIIDFGITGKCGFLYCKDYRDQMKERNSYFNLEDMPFPLSVTSEELELCILEFSEELYQKKWKQFYIEQYGLQIHRDATKKIVERIQKEIGN